MNRSFVQYKQDTIHQLNILNSNWYLCPFCTICELKALGKLGCFWWETECNLFSTMCKNIEEMELVLNKKQNWRNIK